MAATKVKQQLSPREVMRKEVAAANRDKHESAYFLHVALPLAMDGYPYPKTQAMLIPGRKYRFDFCYDSAQLAIEVQGQIWKVGGHTSGYGITRDAEKFNQLACIGWRLLVITPEMITDGRALDYTRQALKAVRRAA